MDENDIDEESLDEILKNTIHIKTNISQVVAISNEKCRKIIMNSGRKWYTLNKY